MCNMRATLELFSLIRLPRRGHHGLVGLLHLGFDPGEAGLVGGEGGVSFALAGLLGAVTQ